MGSVPDHCLSLYFVAAHSGTLEQNNRTNYANNQNIKIKYKVSSRTKRQTCQQTCHEIRTSK